MALAWTIHGRAPVARGGGVAALRDLWQRRHGQVRTATYISSLDSVCCIGSYMTSQFPRPASLPDFVQPLTR
jgi:hypothetical protein